MSVVSMTKRTSHILGYEYNEIITDGKNGNTVKIPPIIARGITCRIICGSNTGKLQTTISTDADVTDGTCTWEDHPAGNVTGTFSDVVVGPVTGIRAVSVSGEINFEMIA